MKGYCGLIALGVLIRSLLESRETKRYGDLEEKEIE